MKFPIKTFKQELYPKGTVTQWFGENPALYAYMGLAGHNGQDHVAPHGEPMYAIEDATVVNVNNDPKGYGKHVRILSDKANAAGHYHEWTYGHCDTISVAVGQKVKEGEQIATMGNTGFVVSGSTPFWKSNPYAGTHLHLGLREMRRMNRGGWSYPGSTIKLDAINYKNGYKGAIDPYPVLAGMTSQETFKRAQLLTVVSLARTLIGLLKQKKHVQ